MLFLLIILTVNCYFKCYPNYFDVVGNTVKFRNKEIISGTNLTLALDSCTSSTYLHSIEYELSIGNVVIEGYDGSTYIKYMDLYNVVDYITLCCGYIPYENLRLVITNPYNTTITLTHLDYVTKDMVMGIIYISITAVCTITFVFICCVAVYIISATTVCCSKKNKIEPL